ncbi:hypothetical protein BGX27_006015, partial [Mortierella sp. AM989]
SSALVFRIMEYEDIWVAGKALNSIILPTTISEFQLFLQDSAHTLFRLLDDYDAFAKEVRSAKEVYDYRQKALVQDDFATLFDHPVTRILKWEKIVLHSPSKSQQALSKQAQPKYQDISEYSKKSITFLGDDWTLDNDNDISQYLKGRVLIKVLVHIVSDINWLLSDQSAIELYNGLVAPACI